MTNPENIDYVGINAKLNEFNAAMGLCVLDDIHIIKEKRKKNWFIYNSLNYALGSALGNIFTIISIIMRLLLKIVHRFPSIQ